MVFVGRRRRSSKKVCLIDELLLHSVIDLNLLFRAPAGGNAGAAGGGQASQQGILRFYTDEAPGFQM
jgi:hypothetical protein